MTSINIPKTFKIGGFDYTFEVSPEHDRELNSNGNQGECSHTMRRIIVRSNLTPQQVSETFLHECIHAVDGVYCNYKLTEDEVYQLGNGLFQILEQLGIRFTINEAAQ